MENTVDSILESFIRMSKNQGVIDPHTYLLGCEKLNALLQNEQNDLYDMEQQVALMRKAFLEDGKSVSFAKAMIEASDAYKEVRKQKAKIDRAIETIRLGKLHARMSQDLMGGQK